MDQKAWRQEIEQLPVFDTHTHLNMPGVPIPARDFWDIAHYFWFQQELWSVGYPPNAPELPEAERLARFVGAFQATRNTVWNQIVREMVQNLYGIELCDAASIRRTDAAVRDSFRRPDWPRQVLDRLAIRSIAVNDVEHARFPELPGVGVAVPSRCGFDWQAWSEKLAAAPDPCSAGRQAADALDEAVGELHAAGMRGMRVDLTCLAEPGGAQVPDDLSPSGADEVEIERTLTHSLLRALSARGMFAQLFLGISAVTLNTSMAIGDPRRIIDLYPLFERYECGFELIIGSPDNNMDAVQPARIYPNVHLGGLWWYNFRSSTYRQVMQQRLEAVPASKCALVASDARCIEWCYGKILLVKRLLADFLFDQVAQGWIDRHDALWVAREWLHDAPARRYLP